MEIELRLGKCPPGKRGSFDTNIPASQFSHIIESLQGYDNWDETSYVEEVTGYFPKVDESVRFTVSNNGSVKTTSKQKVTQADYVGKNLPFDFRLAVNLELDMQESARFTLASATRVVTRKRNSFLLGNVRYDLTRVVEENGNTSHQIELELVHLTEMQIYHDNAQSVLVELQARLVDLMNSVEPIRAFNIELLRKRHF